jgi:hypothetical protein
VIPPRADLDDEDTRLLTYRQAHAAAVEHLGTVAAISADISATVSGPGASSDVDPLGADQLDGDHELDGDELADQLRYRAALAALSGVVQRSMRDFLS